MTKSHLPESPIVDHSGNTFHAMRPTQHPTDTSAKSSLKILVVEDDTAIAAALTAVLLRRGHDVVVVHDALRALECDAPDVLLSDVHLPGASGFDLASELHRRGIRPRTVFMTGDATLDNCRRALLLGAAEFLVKPFRIEDVIRAVEAGNAKPETENTTRGSQTAAREIVDFQRTYASEPSAVARAARDVIAFALVNDVGPACRARIGTAVAEIVDNSRRHGYGAGQGAIRVTVKRDRRDLLVCVEDDGSGFEMADVEASAFGSTLDNGLARALSLAEDLVVDSTPGAGARVTLTFTAWTASLSDGLHVDLSEHDFLTPDIARRVLHTLRRTETADMFQLSPSLAVVVGRLLAGPDSRARLERALWS